MPNEIKLLAFVALILAILSNFVAVYKYQKAISAFITGFATVLFFVSFMRC